MYDVFGIGNPLLDAIVKVNDSHLVELSLKKGHMHLVDENYSKKIFDRFKNNELMFVPGGDVVNTMTGIANLGGKTIFLGKIGADKHGFIIEETMNKDGVKTILIKGDKPTGSCISLVTPDNERTLITHLGSAITLTEKEIILKDIKNSKILYITGYILEDPILRNICILAMDEARKHNKKIAIDVADPGVVKRAKDDICSIIKKYANIVFANEEEVLALTGKPKEEGLNKLSKLAEIAIVKNWQGGSIN
ncbi:MAG: adenosine kinase [Nanoarchaeota archaeon]|nr:adenosine kinase [Nanoarchaeota archaeon]MBU1605169.1 adenosine kinase [Nanoarchaeota archaeon]